MKLPVIKSVTEFIEGNDEDYVHETVEVLEHLTESDSLKDETTQNNLQQKVTQAYTLENEESCQLFAKFSSLCCQRV